MLPPFPSEPQGPSNMVIEALPLWQEAGELGDHRQYMFHYHTIMCPQFANGYCPRHKASRSAPPQCFCYHFESQRRRPLVDTLTGQLRYWDVLCEHIGEGEECPSGDLCPFSHTREEISYHAAKYKTKFCNDRDCRGQEVCCFAHGESELRSHALERYSYWSIFGGGPGGAPAGQRSPNTLHDFAIVASSGAGVVGGRNSATGALYHPKVYKHRFCASYPHVTSCRRGDACAFAHSREEIRTPLLAGEEEDQRPSALTNDFFMYRFKTLWCPVGVQHDWQTCVYAHNYQDARRHPGIGYGPRPCPYWKRKETALEYSQRCPLGVRCPFSHGAKEQLYHPAYFKTVTCQDWPNSNCPRGKLCAFWHKRSQQRARPSSEDEFNYKLPIPEKRLEDALQVDFLSPPFKLLNSLQAEAGQCEGQGQQEMGPSSEFHGGRQEPEMLCQAPLDPWAPALRGYSSAATTATPTNVTDSDEAASADSSSGSDKTPAVHDEDAALAGQALPCGLASVGGAASLGTGWPAEALGLGDLPWMQSSNGAGQLWGLGPWGGEGMPMPGFGPSPGGCNVPQQMMCYVPVQPAEAGPQQPELGGVCHGGHEALQQMPMLNDGTAMCSPCGGCGMCSAPMGLPQLPPEPGPVMQLQGGEAVPMCCGSPPPFGGVGSYDLSMAYGYGDVMFGSHMGLMVGGMRFFDMGNHGALQLPAVAAGEFGPHEGDPAWTPEEAMPTCNGFIHFKEADESDHEALAGRRPRANSH